MGGKKNGSNMGLRIELKEKLENDASKRTAARPVPIFYF